MKFKLFGSDKVWVLWEFENWNYICWQVNEVDDIIDFERKIMIEESHWLRATYLVKMVDGEVLGYGEPCMTLLYMCTIARW